MDRHEFFHKGFQLFPRDRRLDDWVAHAWPAACRAVRDPANRKWLRCGGTWFAGVNVLSNDRCGSVDNGPALAGGAVAFIREAMRHEAFEWDQAQVSVCYPGYPEPAPEESVSAHHYRRKRDAAHVDGLLAVGVGRRRHIREHHGFLLGIPLCTCGPGASPFVVWEGSHVVMRNAFGAALGRYDASVWPEIDVTEAYQSARREVFATCRRVEIPSEAGRAYVVHRLALHGMAPWTPGAPAGAEGRMIAYFRPACLDAIAWLNRD